MRCRYSIFLVFVLTCTVGLITPQAAGEDEGAPSQEYKVKAAFLYNFLKFVDWPNGKEADADQPITLGIIGKDPFEKAFEPVKDKKVKNRDVVIKRFKSVTELIEQGEKGKSELDKQIEAAKKCHLLFICSSEKEGLKEILTGLKDCPVLTVGDSKDLLESGGIINFVMEQQKVRFEINESAAKRSRLKISSQLLRLARKVVK